MRSLSRKVFLAAVGGVLILGLSAPVRAAETSNSEIVIIRADDTVTDDLYVGAIRVVIEGTLDGDLVAFAADEVLIEGVVTGSVMAVAPRLTIDGTVGESVRFTGRDLAVSGDIQGDLVGVAWSAGLAETSTVSGDVLLWAWNLSASGSIGADLNGSQRHLRLAGEVLGDVDVSVRQLTVTGPLAVAGDFGYRSGRDAEGLDQAEVGGTIVAKRPLPPNLRVRALALLGRFMVILFLSIAALTVAYGWPARTTRAIGAVRKNPVRKWLVGAMFIFAPVVLLAIAAVVVGLAPPAASFPLLAVFIPIVIALTGLSLALGLFAGVPVAGFVGGAAFRKLDLYGAILAGSLLTGIVWLLPWLGWLVPLLALPWGLGAWISVLGQPDGSDPPSGVPV